MNCPQVRKALYPTPEKCLLRVEAGEALEHIRECEACQSYFEAQSEWSRALKEKAGTDLAPAHLRDSVARQIERRARRPSPGRRRLAAVAAAAVIVAVPAAWLAYRASSQQFFETVCEDHARYRNAESEFRASDPAAIERWFDDRAGFGVRVPALANAEVVGARLCFLKKRKAALVFYRKRGRTVSLFQFSGRGLTLRALEGAVIDGAPLWRMSYKGFNLAAFEDRGLFFVLVSDLRESELLQLASAARVEPW